MSRKRIECVSIVVIVLVALGLVSPATAHEEQPFAREMADAANQFVASLSGEQKAQAAFAFDSDKREGWHFFPDKFIPGAGRRYGLAFKDMSEQQRLLAQALLSTGLSSQGHRQTLLVMSLEAILHDLEGGNAIRDPGLYYVSIFGQPSIDATWAWRLEGHHLSVNFTLVDGHHVSVTPSFYGANPGRVPSGSQEGLRALAAEEDVARRLVRSLNESQRSQAIIAAEAPKDIITGADRKVSKGAFEPAEGIAYASLNERQQKLLVQLVHTFARKYRPSVLKEIRSRGPIVDPASMVFAWAGGVKPGEGHYFRVQTSTYLFEYDNTQNDANHIHAVWRSFDGDFGRDLLSEHYRAEHSQK